MDNFDLKKYLVENRATEKVSQINEKRLEISYYNNEDWGTVDTRLIDALLKQIGPYIGYSDWEDKIQNPDYEGIIQKIAKHISGTGTLSNDRLKFK